MFVLSEQEMRKAIIANDKSYDGRFFYGVITTGVFCKPSCSSRELYPNLRTAFLKSKELFSVL